MGESPKTSTLRGLLLGASTRLRVGIVLILSLLAGFTIRFSQPLALFAWPLLMLLALASLIWLFMGLLRNSRRNSLVAKVLTSSILVGLMSLSSLGAHALGTTFATTVAPYTAEEIAQREQRAAERAERERQEAKEKAERERQEAEEKAERERQAAEAEVAEREQESQALESEAATEDSGPGLITLTGIFSTEVNSITGEVGESADGTQLFEGIGCHSSFDYKTFSEGEQVLIKSELGQRLGVGYLEPGVFRFRREIPKPEAVDRSVVGALPDSFACDFRFEITGLPPGEKSYILSLPYGDPKLGVVNLTELEVRRELFIEVR